MDEKIIDPVSRELLLAELTPDKKLCDTNKSDNEIYVIDCNDAPNVLQEIGRLREIAFRDSGGGTGQAVDLDEFDTDPAHPYKQLIIWDPEANAILGGYRYILGPDIQLQEDGQPHITSSHMFHYSEQFIQDYLPHVMELGRSFVAPEYQSSKAGAKAIFALDNLWDGIAAVILGHPGILYFLGKMTIYPSYDKTCRELIQHFLVLHDEDYKADYRNLKEAVRKLGFNIPPLVNSYMNASPTMKMLGTGINDEFFDCYDTGIMISFEEMYADKRDRHKVPYFKYLATRIRLRFPGLRTELEDLVERISIKKESDRERNFSAFLNRSRGKVRAAEKNLRRRVRRLKKEKVEP